MERPSRRDAERAPLTTRTIVAWFGVYVLFGVLSFVVLRKATAAVVPVWLPAGIGFALQLRAGPGQRLPLALVHFAVELALEELFGVYQSLPLHLTYSASVAFESWLAASVARRMNGGRDVLLDTVGELRVFVGASVVATVAAGMLAALVEIRVLSETYLVAVATWVQADLVAFVVITPLALISSEHAGLRLRGRYPQALLVLATVVGVAGLLFGRTVPANSVLVPLSFLLFPPLIWAALSFGVFGAASGSVLLSILVGLLTEMKLGPIAALGFDAFTRQLISQGFVGLLAISALTIGVLTRQQRGTRERLQAALVDAEEAAARFRSFFEGTPEMLAAVDREGRVVLANRRWMGEFSAFYNQQSVIGLRVEDLAAGAGDEALATVAWWRRALAGESVVTPWSLSRWDGSTHAYEMSLSPLRDDAGRVVGAQMSVRDVADLRNRQQAEARARRLETVGRLAGGVAHDFNNIITGIQGYVQLLSDALPPGHEGHEDLSGIRHAGDRAAALTRQLLAYARRQVIEPRQVNVADLLHGLTGLLQRLIGEDVALQLDAQGALWPVRVDPGQLEQVVMNLAVNARDAMPAGGRLLIECRNAVVGTADAALRDLAPGDYVAIAVSDTGDGMSPEVLERVFEPFFTTKGQGKGTGLGLATVDGIVRQVGGAIIAYSEVGIGTTFRVYLPRDPSPPPRVSPVAVPVVPRPHGQEHLILVEDDDAVRALARRVLEQRGFSVQAFADGAAAMEIDDASLARASLLLTDVVLPGLHGREISERLRARAPHLVVLFVSGYTEDAVVHHGVLDEGVSFLAKPFTPDQLVAKVRSLLDA